MLRILGYTQLYTLVVLMLTSCCQDRQAMERAEQALQEVGERYHAEKVICDSLLDIVSSYYLPDLAKGDTTLSSLTSSPQQAECMLYEGILHHDRAQELRPDIEAYTAEMAKAYRLFLEVERNVELLPDSYLKGVVNDRMACLYLQNGNPRQALLYFQKELNYAFEIKDTTSITVAYMHLSYPYNYLNEGDSTLYYCNQALYYAPYLEGRLLAALYNNIAYFRNKYKSTQEMGDSLLYQIPFESCTRDDSCRIYNVLIDYSLEKGNYTEADHLTRWAITHADSKPELLSMAYLRRSRFFEQKGMLDSALIMHKAFAEQQMLVQQSKQEVEFTKAHSRYEQLLQQRHYEHIVAVITVTALVITLLLLLLWLRRTKQKRQLELRIASINAKMDQYSFDITQLKSSLDQQMAESYDKEEKLRFQLNQSRSDYRLSQSKIERMLSHFFLLRDETSWPSEILSELLDIYRQTSSDRKKLLDELDNLSLSQRQKVICLLIRESKHDPKQLWFYAGCTNEAAFQSSKSQIKKKLQEAAPSSPVIQSLLNHFPQERTTVLKSKPKLKNEGK